MSSVQEGLRELAEPWPGGSPVKAAIDRAARRAGFSYWRCFDLWYGKARRIEQFEIEALEAAIERKRREEARNELHDLRIRLARLEARMAQSDPEFFRPSIEAIRRAGFAGGAAVGTASDGEDGPSGRDGATAREGR